LALVLPGCGADSTGSAKLENYVQRLARGLDMALPQAQFVAPPRILDAGLEPLVVPPASIGVLDFLALSGCELQVNLGRRNSSLGRHASASQRLLLDLEFLKLVPPCIEYLQAENTSELAAELARIAEQRRQQLPQRIYNAVLAAPEFQSFWRLPPSLSDYPSQINSEVVDALTWLTAASDRWLNGDYSGEFDEDRGLEHQLARLRSGDGGALMLAAVEVARTLQQATETLQNSAHQRKLCPGGHRSERATITETVTVKFFAGDVQPWLAALNSRRHALMPPLEHLEQLLADILPPNYEQWRQERNTRLTALQQQPKMHVAAIKNAMADCPGVPWHS